MPRAINRQFHVSTNSTSFGSFTLDVPGSLQFVEDDTNQDWRDQLPFDEAGLE
ncbi:MAG: hypothetical protein KIT57_09075 [Blastocatellales bacterium]|nr:hypothetical protein [Blastocatellales bacterium]